MLRADRAGDHFRQAVIRLRPQHNVDKGRAGHDLGTLGLGHAAGHGDDHVGAGGGFGGFQRANPPQI